MADTKADVKLRILTATDVSLAREMLAMFSIACDDAVAYVSHPPSDDYVLRLLGSSNFIAIVAVDGTRVVGGVVAYVLAKLEQERSEIYVYDLAIDAEYRRRGIATSLIREVQTVGDRLGAKCVYVQAFPEDEAAVSLYAKMGSRRDVVHFELEPTESF